MSNSAAKQAYRAARALHRANGNYAFKWMGINGACMIRHQQAIAGAIDWLAQRAAWRASGMDASLAIRLR